MPEDAAPALQIPIYIGIHLLQHSFSFLAMTLSSLCGAFIACSLLDLPKCDKCLTSDAFEVFVAVKFHTFIKLLLTTFSIIFSWMALTGFFTSLAKDVAAGYGIIILFSFWLWSSLIIYYLTAPVHPMAQGQIVPPIPWGSWHLTWELLPTPGSPSLSVKLLPCFSSSSLQAVCLHYPSHHVLTHWN